MPRKPSPVSRALITARWPLGLAITSFSYTWRTTPVHRREREGSWSEDAPPDVRTPVDLSEVLSPEDGTGPYLRRRYQAIICDSDEHAAGVMAELMRDPNLVVPSGLAHFSKTRGDGSRMRIGDEFTVRMPGPWDGPVRVVDLTATSFRFATLAGHIEAGQIEWRARDEGHTIVFEIESWSRPGDRLSHVMHHRLRMAKEVQLHMWTSVLERAIRRYGHRARALDIETRTVTMPS